MSKFKFEMKLKAQSSNRFGIFSFVIPLTFGFWNLSFLIYIKKLMMPYEGTGYES
jgi:hypothetical protein